MKFNLINLISKLRHFNLLNLIFRSCGRVFCADCSENSTPLPSEQLYNPVRVCSDCFCRLHHRTSPCQCNSHHQSKIESEVDTVVNFEETASCQRTAKVKSMGDANTVN